MIKMSLDYAQKVLDGQYCFGHCRISCYDNIFVISSQDEYSDRTYYYGTTLLNGQLQTDSNGMVVFKHVTPVVDENTRFSFS